MRAAVVAVVALLAACRAPDLGTTEQEAVYTSPASWDFGSVPLGQTSAPRTIVVGVNLAQYEYHTITGITEPCDDFELDLSTLDDPAVIYRECEACPTCAQAAAAICTTQTQVFSVRFRPTVPGAQACTITIELDSGGPKYVTVNGTGQQPDYLLTLLSPLSGSLAFGDVIVGQTSAGLPVTVRSDGSMPIDISDTTFAGGGASFAMTNGGAGTLQPGDSRTITLTCAPTAEGAVNDTFLITSNAPASPLGIPVSCNGIVSNLAITPSPAQTPEVIVGESTFVDVTLQNVGSAAMTIDSATITPAAFQVADLTGMSIDAGATLAARVDFVPTADLADTDVRGTLTVNYDGTQSRTIEVVAPVRSSILSVSPGGEVDFGTVCGGQSARQLFAAVNLGTKAFDVESASVTGDGFTLSLQPASYPVALTPRAGNTVAFEITAAPTATGPVSGQLTLTPTNPNIPPTIVELRAVGQADGVAASPLILELDTVLVGESSGGRAVRLTNCEPTPLEVSDVSVFGRDATEFSAVSDLAVPGAIPAFDGATWLVELRPQSEGEKAASLQITHGAGITTIALSGAGDDGLDDEDGRGSYYACSSGGGGGTAGAALALFLLVLIARIRRYPRTS